jgi:hypothetical protein
MKNNFITFLRWILKIEDQKPEMPKYFGYMINRWLSFATKSNAQIVNVTTNRWNYPSSMEDNILSMIYYTIIPKHAKRIDYVKKNQNESEEEVDDSINFFADSLELSTREIEMYNNSLEEMNITAK